MKGSFKTVSVAEIASPKKGGIAIGPFGSKMKSDSYVDEGVPVIRGLNIGDSKGLEGEFVYISEEDAKRMGNANVYNGDLVFPHRGAIGRVGLIADSEDGHAVLSSSLMKLTVNQKKAIPEFVFYYFRSKLGVHEILKYSSTVGTPGIGQPLTSLKSMKLPLPEISEQRRIAHILGTLDDKIALNRQQNATLEAMAQALFRSWFVDFDPVLDKALTAGHDIPEPLQAKAQRRLALGDQRKPLPPKVAGLFPDRFVYEEEVGWVPEGWAVSTVTELTEKIQNGGTPKRSDDSYWVNGDIPWLTSGEVRQKYIENTENRITSSGLKNSSAKWIPSKTTVVAMYGATAGQVGIIGRSVTTNQAICSLIPKPDCSYHVFLHLSEKMSFLANQARGSAQQNISKKIIESLVTLIPYDLLLIEFHQRVEPF
jgi:type I restriction enzyme, S subunit